MNFRQLILTTISMLSSGTAQATNSSFTSQSESPKGKAIVRIFTNFHTGFGPKNDDRGFDLDRSYLGYEYQLGHGLSVKGIMDFGRSSDVDDYQRIAYVKNAMLTWKYDKLTINGGLISTTLFNLQEKCWGYRYLLKSFQDGYGFGSSADLGISASYRFFNWLSADAILVNGEGYKKVQIGNGLQYGFGITLTPIDGLTMRVYGSLNESFDQEGKDCYNLATFVSYHTNGYTLACEYNKVSHAKYLPENHMQGVSVYGSAQCSRRLSAFLRYDQLFTDGTAVREKEQIQLTGGVEFKLGKYVKLSPNFRYVHPTGRSKNYCMAYISCYFGI